ncbi:MAG: hypothetical protein ABJA64_02610 [Candidatus Saccharibacteria bacterium]
MKKIKIILGILVATILLTPVLAYASPTGRLNQSITSGTLSTDIRDASYVTVGSPSFNMTAATVSNACQTITGTYGDNAQRVYVDNPGGANNGFTLAIASTAGSGALWTSGGNTYDFDDAAGGGCTNGQLTLDPSVSTLGLDGSSTSTGITKGTATAFLSNSSITLLNAAAGSDDIWRGYLTGIGVSQKIPASKPAGTYVLDLTQTVTAL